jgi:hypothetical protein
MIDTWAAQHPGDDDTGTRCNASTGSDGERIDYVLVWNAAPAPGITAADVVQWGVGCPSDPRPVVATVVLPPDPS